MSRRKFDRYMVVSGAGRHIKFARLTDAERCAHFLGVLSIAAQAPVRGCLLVGEQEAEALEVAQEARVTEKAAASALRKLKAVGVLTRDDDLDCWRVHDWADVNPEPKTDATNAERQQRYRDRRKARNAPSNAPSNGVTSARVTPSITPPEVEGEVEEQTALSDESDLERARNRLQASSEQQVFDAWMKATGKTGATILTDKRRRVIRGALKLYALADVIDAVQGWQHSPHHRGENERRTVYNDLELLLRDAEHIERFRDLNRNGSAPEPRGDGFGDRLRARTVG
jgi:hypothetical protein